MFDFLKRMFPFLNPEPERGSVAETNPLNAHYDLTTDDLDFVLKAMDSVEPLSDVEKQLLKSKLDALGILGKNNVPLPNKYQGIVNRLVSLSEDMREHRLSQKELQVKSQILREDLLMNTQMTTEESTLLKENLKAKRIKNSVILEGILERGISEEAVLLNARRNAAFERVKQAQERLESSTKFRLSDEFVDENRAYLDSCWAKYIEEVKKTRKIKSQLEEVIPHKESKTSLKGMLDDGASKGKQPPKRLQQKTIQLKNKKGKLRKTLKTGSKTTVSPKRKSR